MNIKTKLIVAKAIPIILALLLGLVVLLTNRQIDEAFVNGGRVDNLAKDVFLLDIATSHYLLNAAESSKTNFLTLHSSLAAALSKLEVRSREEQDILLRLRRNHAAVKAIFMQLVTLRESRDRESSTALLPAGEKRLTQLFMVSMSEMVADSLLLATSIDNHVKAVISRSHSRIIICTLLLALFAVVMLFVIDRYAMGTITRLQQGTAIVAGGNLDYEIAIKSRDEIGELSAAFNQMTRELKNSRSALEQSHSELEQRVRERTAALEASNQEHESFTYTVSHDLRAPLRAIDGFSRILMKESAAKLDEEGRRVLQVIRKNTQTMGQLIDDLLAFSRLGRQTITLSDLDLTSMGQDVYEEIVSAVPGRAITFDLKTLPPVRGDKALMRQVVFNLLANAVKFTGPRTDARIEFGGWVEGKENIYFVKDNGAGFDMQYIDKLFGVFQRLHGMEEFEGTGVGLAIVRRTILKHGGRVWAEGKINEGATFYFSLPNSL